MDKVFTNIEHANWLREQAAAKRPYWYGVPYQRCTEALLRRKAKQYPGHYGASRMARYRQDIAAGQFAGDCVNGAIKGAVWSELGRREPIYASHDCPDKSADGMFEYCKGLGMDWGAIGSMPDEIGLAVRFAGHVGIYVGNGEVVEWRGFAYGCVITRLSARPWTHWYRLPWTEYVSGDTTYPGQNTDYGTLGGRLLKRGSKGEDVRTLQELLMSLGYALPKYGADGDFGRETEAAVKAFQKDHHLMVDGEYGPRSHAAMEAALAIEDKPVEAPKQVKITGGQCYIRAEPNTSSAKLGVAKEGTVWPFAGSVAENGWLSILYNGQICWVSNNYGSVKEG